MPCNNFQKYPGIDPETFQGKIAQSGLESELNQPLSMPTIKLLIAAATLIIAVLSFQRLK